MTVSCLQVMPAGAWFVSVVLVLHLFFVIGSPRGTTAFAMSAQEVVVIVAAVGSGACIVMCTLVLPRMKHRLTSRGPTIIGLKRMNLLGLVRACN